MKQKVIDRPTRRSVLGGTSALLATSSIGDQAAAADRMATGIPAAGIPNPEALMLDARAFGVVGDGRHDDTRAVQAFLDLCAKQGGRVAYFGSLTVRITGPLVSRVGIVFEPASYGGAGSAGFVASGTGFTALTVLGSVADFCVTLTGDGTMDIPANGAIQGDRRPRINGIAFGSTAEPFAMSTVRSVRVNNLAGFGVRHWQCWDVTFLSVSVERCGSADAYAFDVAGDAQHTCNETTWVRVQVEQAIGGAIRIDPGALSCTFLKIHGERAVARSTVPTWVFGGSCVYDSVRLTAMNPTEAVAHIISNQAEFRNLRAEDNIRVIVNASGGTVNFHNPGAVFQTALNQSGIVNIFGGVLAAINIGGGWNLFGSHIGRLEVGFMPAELFSTLTSCIVDDLAPQSGASQGALILTGTRATGATVVAGNRLRALHLHAGSSIVPRGGTLHCADQVIAIDATSSIKGDVRLQRVSLRLAGSVTGNLTIDGPVHDARADDSAAVGGTVRGWGPPTLPGTPGAWSANLSPAMSPASKRFVAGWRYVNKAWHPARVDVEN